MTSSISIQRNEAFGNPNYKVVQLLLDMVDKNMMSALELAPFSSKQCVVIPGDEDPMCCDGGINHIIVLNVKDDYWCQWVFQFSHEYCHHLINGTLSGEWSGLLWFEETLCQVSSLYNLHKMFFLCSNTASLASYAPGVKQYLENELKKSDEYINVGESGWLNVYDLRLREELYNRDLYRAIASVLYPLFLENPHLWKILLNIGDIRSWKSLKSLFDHLAAAADLSYINSFVKLRTVFEV